MGASRVCIFVINIPLVNCLENEDFLNFCCRRQTAVSVENWLTSGMTWLYIRNMKKINDRMRISKGFSYCKNIAVMSTFKLKIKHKSTSFVYFVLSAAQNCKFERFEGHCWYSNDVARQTSLHLVFCYTEYLYCYKTF